MIALFITIWLVGAIIVGGSILFMAMITSIFFGSISWKETLLVVAISAIWPVYLILGLINVVYQGIRKR